MSFSEFGFISKLPRPPAPGLILGIGDDAAIVQDSQPWAISTDALAEGRHFLGSDSPYDIGYKIAAVNLSDMAAMGCQPRFFLLNLHLSPDWADQAKVQELMGGLLDTLKQYNTTLIGGDTVTSCGGGLQASGTILGTPFSHKAVLRSGARSGDLIGVTGALGGSFPNRHLRFTPRVKWSQLLCTAVDVHALMDLSDGLSQDLGHICDASGVGAELDLWKIPIHRDAQGKNNPLDAALSDGEDFELLFTIDKKDLAKIPPEVIFTIVGRCTSDQGILTAREHPEGEAFSLERKGFKHDG
jgi:thiamine-monophosphate kinase